jgi:hypothetical protein
MKKIKSNLNILIAISVLVFFNACNKHDDQPEKTNFIEGKVNGAPWTPSSVKCVLLENDALNFRVISFTATYAGKTITIEADDQGTGTSMNTGTRTYELGSAYFLYNVSTSPYHTITGSINITGNDASQQLVSGSFRFSAQDDDGNVAEVTDGNFEKVKFTKIVQ